MLIISWNVAGWSHTVHRITDAYSSSASAQQQTSSTNSKIRVPPPPSSSSTAALEYYLNRHQVDILCLQEHKIPLSQLSSRSEPRQCSTIPGYESFWSCCVSQEKNKRGFNGVVTYVKQQHVGTQKANGTCVLGIPELDTQGRCVMTDHGNFVIFNVYVPALGGQGLSVRMKFLRALRKAAHYQRTVCQKHVMMVGDFNIAHTKRDRFWKDRIVYIEDVLHQVQTERRQTQQQQQHKTQQEEQTSTVTETINNIPSSPSGASSPKKNLPQWKYDVAQHWSTIIQVLKETKQVVPIQTTNPTTGEKFNKFRLFVVVGTNAKKIYLGKHESSQEHCLWEYESLEEPSTYRDPDTDEICTVRDANTVSIHILEELMMKIVGVVWENDKKTASGRESNDSSASSILRQIANDESVTGVNRESPSIKWFAQMVEEDGMVDTLRHYYPTAEGRFTCWDQFKNRRYDNEGVRLDYILIDQALLSFLQKGPVNCLRSGCAKDGEHQYDPLSEDAAWAATTANGQFQPVSFQGGGIESVSQAILDTQFADDEPHTGIIYTPPSFSDHVGVSALFDNSILRSSSSSRDDDKKQLVSLDLKDACTRKAQPHKAQRSIMSFLQNNNTTTNFAKNAKQTTNKNKEEKKLLQLQQGQQKHSFFRTSSMKTSATRKREAFTKQQPKHKQSRKASFFVKRQQASANDGDADATEEQRENPPTSTCTTLQQHTTEGKCSIKNKKKPRATCSSSITAVRSKKKQKLKVLPRKGSILQHFTAANSTVTASISASSTAVADDNVSV